MKIDKNLRVIVLLSIVSCLADSLSLYLTELKKDNFVLYNGFILFEGLLLFYYFSQILIFRHVKAIIGALSIIFFVSWLWFFVRLGASAYADAVISFENISIIILSIIYYFNQLSKTEASVIYNKSHFWVVSGYLIYIAGTFFLVLYIASFKPAEQLKFYSLNYIFVIIKSVLLSVAMFMNTPTQPKKFQLT